MKRFLLVLGIFLCLQSCAVAKNLYDVGNGIYVDIDSFERVGNYGYVEAEIHSPVLGFSTATNIWKFDLINHKVRIMKVGVRDIAGNLVAVLEEFEISKDLQGWRDIQDGSPIDKAFKAIKNINETIPN